MARKLGFERVIALVFGGEGMLLGIGVGLQVCLGAFALRNMAAVIGGKAGGGTDQICFG